MGLNAKDDGSKFRHDQAERLRDHDVPPELRDETPDEKAARVRRDLAEGRTGWGEEGASWGGWRAQARGETEFWGYGDRPGIGMSDEEKFHFDLAGFFVRPAVLSADEVAALREQVHTIAFDPYSLPPSERKCPGGAASMLIDHPKVIEVLHEIIGPEVRLEAAGSMWRAQGEREESGQGWHNGGPRSTDPIMGYRYHDGIIHAGMVRVIFELSEIKKTDGATHFIPGSHKANFPMNPRFLRELEPQTDAIDDADRSELIAGYSCPAGSIVFFSEALAHVGPTWRGEHPRAAILHSYTHLCTNTRRLHDYVPPAVLAGLPPEKQAYFRAPWQSGTLDPDEFAPSGTAFNTVERFVRKPSMTWSAALPYEAGGGLMERLADVERMERTAFLTPEEAEQAKAAVLAEARERQRL